MIGWIIRIALRHRVFAFGFALVIIALGLWCAWHLPMDAMPDITSLKMDVNTQIKALAPEEIEKQITVPLERQLAGVPGLKLLRSTSTYGLSQISLIFEDGVRDVYQTRQIVTERLQLVRDVLPANVQPVLSQASSGLGEIYYYQVAYKPDAKDVPVSEKEALTQLKLIEDYQVAPRFLEVKGVADVSTLGGFVSQIVIQPDPARLASMGIGLQEIATAVRANTSNTGGGVVESAGEAVIVRSDARVSTIKEIEGLALRYGSGVHPILIKDVALVQKTSAPRQGAALVDGKEAVIGAVVMLRGENAREIAAQVDQRLKEIQADLPPGIPVISLYNRGDLVANAITTIQHNLFAGALLVAIVLFIFLGNWRAALVVASTIPVSLLIAMTGMRWFEINGNLISLGAIDFGLIVDGSVVIVDHILRRLGTEQSRLGRLLTFAERSDCIEEACVEVSPSIVAGVGIITLVYVPIFALSGVEGKMFEPLAAAVTMALAGALLLAITLIPVLCLTFLNRRVAEHENRLVLFLQHGYGRLLDLCILRWKSLTLAATLLFALASFVFFNLESEFVPSLDEGTGLAIFLRAPGIDLESAVEIQAKSNELLRKNFPELGKIFSRIGSDDNAVDAVGLDDGDSYLIYAFPDRWRLWKGNVPDKQELTDRMHEELMETIPGQTVEFVQPVEDRFNDFLQGARADIAIKIRGEDLNQLETLGSQILDVMESMPNASNAAFNSFRKSPMLEIHPDRAALARVGLQADDLNASIFSSLGGDKLGEVLEGDRTVDIVLRMNETLRNQAGNLELAEVKMADGGLIPVSQIATAKMVDRVSRIERESGKRQAVVVCNVRGSDLQGFVQELKKKVADEVKPPDGFTIQFEGAFKNLESATARLKLIVPLVLLAIFFLIYAAFKNFRQVAIIYSSIPLAATGGVISLSLRQLPFSIPAAIGFIALSGIAVLNGIVMISEINRLRRGGMPSAKSVREGALSRLRPVLMTAMVASLGFVPMALAHGPGAEVQRPLATVVIGGILSSTFLTLVLIPALCTRFGHEDD